MIKSVNKLESKLSKNLASDSGIFLLRTLSLVLLFAIKYTEYDTLKFFNNNMVKLLLLLCIAYIYFIDIVSAVVLIIVYVVLIKEIKIKRISRNLLKQFNNKYSSCVSGSKIRNEDSKHQEETTNNMIKLVSRENMDAGFKGPNGEIKPVNRDRNNNGFTNANSNDSTDKNTCLFDADFNDNAYSHPSSRTLTENTQNLSMGFTNKKHLKDIQINSVYGSSECNPVESIQGSFNAQGLKAPRGFDNFDNMNSYLK